MRRHRRRTGYRRFAGALTALATVSLATACSSAGPPRTASATGGAQTSPLTTTVPVATVAPTTVPPTTRRTSPATTTHAAPKTNPITSARPSSRATSSSSARPTDSSSPVHVPAGTGPVVVLDPGHSPTIHAIDPATGLNVSDYENEPEMQDVFAVAELVRSRLQAVGYRVVMTKNSATQVISLGQRAAVANDAHAALAVSIHDQAGASGGIGFTDGNNTVYYQSVGTYRENAAGKKFYFTNSQVAATSARYGQIFRDEREHVEQVPVTLLGTTGYDLGSRGLAGGDIWMVQLLSNVPWIYNEAGGNSAGTVGLDSTDKSTYADAIVAGVEHCLPL